MEKVRQVQITTDVYGLLGDGKFTRVEMEAARREMKNANDRYLEFYRSEPLKTACANITFGNLLDIALSAAMRHCARVWEVVRLQRRRATASAVATAATAAAAAAETAAADAYAACAAAWEPIHRANTAAAAAAEARRMEQAIEIEANKRLAAAAFEAAVIAKMVLKSV